MCAYDSARATQMLAQVPIFSSTWLEINASENKNGTNLFQNFSPFEDIWKIDHDVAIEATRSKQSLKEISIVRDF